MKKIISLLGVVFAIGMATTMIGCAEPDPVDTIDYGMKVGKTLRIPFTEALNFNSVVEGDIVYNEDGSVTYTTKAAGGAGGGIAFYLNEKVEKSIINTANYESCTIVLDYNVDDKKWNANAQNPGFCLRLLTTDSTGIFGGYVDVEYFDTDAKSGTLTKTVNFPANLSETVVDASDYDGIKAAVIKFNDYQRGNDDGDLIHVTLKNITFNKKKSAKNKKDIPFDDGLKPNQRGTVYSVKYHSKDYVEYNAKQNAIAKATNSEELEAAEAMTVTEYDKHGWVYTPAGYNADDKETKYPVFILLHGMGQNENTWGLSDQGDGGKIKGYMDRGMADGSVKKFILVVVTGIASKEWGSGDGGNGIGYDFNGFNAFSGELRNDLLPWIYQNFNCKEGRDYTAIAGLSMGGGQTYTNGFLDNLDNISYFGAFSAGVFTPAAAFKMSVDEKWAEHPEYKAHYLYMICGDNDAQVYAGSDWSPSWQSYVDTLNDKAWPERVEKFSSTVVPGGTHDFPVWFKGFKEFITYLF